jgi:hypothetical protein
MQRISPNPKTRNSYDHRGSMEMGNQAEEDFQLCALREGFTITPATSGQDTFEHWDFMLEKGEKKSRVEVKAMKRVDSWDAKTQAEWIWIELHGVRKNDPGWLLGKADYFAFEQSDHFIIVRKLDLQRLVDQLVTKETARIPSSAEYRMYRRPGRHDLLTMIRARDLHKIKFIIWRK